MQDILEKYFHDTDDRPNIFRPGATSTQIAHLEAQLVNKLPSDYKTFLSLTDGFEGFVKEFFVIFDPVEQVHEMTQLYCSTFFPWAIYIGSDGGAEMIIIDTRESRFQFGLLPFVSVDEDFIPLGDTFELLIQRFYNDTAFETT